MSQKVYESVTKKILAKIESGVLPWELPWDLQTMPQNLVSRRPYRGFNVFSLLYSGFKSPFWMTFKQAKHLGGNVRKGEESTPIVFWHFRKYEKEDDKGETTEKTIPSARYFQVFNLEQTEGIEAPVLPERSALTLNEAAMTAAALYIGEQKITLLHGGDRAFYSPKKDLIQMPPNSHFKHPEAYHSTLFHECAHSTGIESRLKRGLDTQTSHFGSERYSKEELVAEFAASFLNAEFGLFTERIADNSAAYLQSWSTFIRGQPSAFISAANQGQRAADFIMGRQFEGVKTEESEDGE